METSQSYIISHFFQKALYVTATLPYIVLAIFFGRAVTLKGSLDGIIHMFKPQVTNRKSVYFHSETIANGHTRQADSSTWSIFSRAKTDRPRSPITFNVVDTIKK